MVRSGMQFQQCSFSVNIAYLPEISKIGAIVQMSEQLGIFIINVNHQTEWLY